MSFGPELVWFWSEQLKVFEKRRLFKADGADSYCVFTFSGSRDSLLLSWNAQFCGAAFVSESEKKRLFASSKQLPPIINLFKSQLTGAELVSVRQLNRDKILEFAFSKTVGAGFVSEFYLVFEIMERYSNLILLDSDRKVVEAAKHVHPAENRYRSVLPGQPYTAPPEFRGISLEAWLVEPDKAMLDEVAGFGRKFRFAVEDKTCSELVSGMKDFFRDSSNMLPQLSGNYFTVYPSLVNEYAQPLSGYRLGREELLAPLLRRELDAVRKKTADKIKHELTRRERQLTDIMNLLNGEDASEFKQRADLITANLWQMKQGSSAEIKCYNDEGEKISVVVPLDPAFTPAKNAERLYAKYKKITAAQNRAAALLFKVQGEIAELNEQLALAQTLEDTDELEALGREVGLRDAKPKNKKNADTLPLHKRFDFDYAIVVAGLSAKGNRYATFKFAKPDDIWFHAQGVPGSHVILRFTRAVTEEERAYAEKFCASLACCFCKTPVYGLRVDFCERKQVTGIPGQTANVTYRDFKSADGDPFFWDESLRASENGDN